jgi:hypothetical protein
MERREKPQKIKHMDGWKEGKTQKIKYMDGWMVPSIGYIEFSIG